MPTPGLRELEAKLSALSHSEEAIGVVEAFSAGLRRTEDRLADFNASRALLRSPILRQDTEPLGFDTPEDAFVLLQGDVVLTEAAFFFGERTAGGPKYIVLNSSCDLVPGKRQNAALLRVVEIRKSDQDALQSLSLLLKFKRRDAMYLPVMPQDAEDVLCNVIDFDGICQIRASDLHLANRLASLTLVGWRIFASLSRAVFARANTREIQMRAAIENLPEQQELGFARLAG